ncbi:KaiC domain protein [Halobacterium hubeiense]|uniref:KaiC domain protein n=1 Tax=Halobacterium hubeiense TaxID=1407499 RepID=A0A0U5D085_9EURY|nr:KaiC domain-containing protein [Halobacterium hubeiense]CQH60525.1 KaiC domain protein [Halobacterium hubeiense]
MADEDDEDWFEKAFAEETETDSDEEPSDAESEAPTAEPLESKSGEETAEPPESFGEAASESDEPTAGSPTPAEPEDGVEPGPESEVDDFAAAFGGGGEPSGGGSEDDDLFEDDFAAAFGGGGGAGAAAPGGEDDFGFDLDGDVGAGGPGGFEEEEEYDSDIPRIDFGIEGLDEMVQGGVPERSLIVAIGGAGTGKTTFGLQFLHEAIQNGERAVYITLEESRQRVVQSATEKGWEFDRHTEEGNLAVIDIDPIEMANSLTSIRNELPRLVEEFGASRLVLDSVSLLEMMYDDQSVRRTEIYDFTKALKDAGVTTMLTSEASEDNPFASRHGIIEYLTDAVVVLRYIRPEDFRETRLAVEIQKIRDANHSRETKPYEITHQGISVYRQANIF